MTPIRVRALAAGLDLILPLVGGGVDDDGAELLLDPNGSPAVALDDHHLVPGLEERLGEMEADLTAAGDHEIHQRPRVGSDADSSSSCCIAAFMRFGPMVLSPVSTASRSVARIVVRENV